MSESFTVIDLSQLPAPDLIETVDYEVILAEMQADLIVRDPEFSALVESDPAYKILEVAAYRETLLRKRINYAAKSVMLAYSSGADLDQLVADRNIQRLEIYPEDTSTIPPTPAVMESDESLRRRALLKWESITTAGSTGSYIFHALSADGMVKDASPTMPTPGTVQVALLSHDGDGTADASLISAVDTALSVENVRPLTDFVNVIAATITNYEILATLYLYSGPDSDVVIAEALSRVTKYTTDNHRIGRDITISGLHAALHVAGVQRVELAEPSATLVVDDSTAAYCTNIQVIFGGRDE